MKWTKKKTIATTAASLLAAGSLVVFGPQMTSMTNRGIPSELDGPVTISGSPSLDLSGSDPEITTDAAEALLVNTTGRVVHIFSDLTPASTSSATYEALATFTIPKELLGAGTIIKIHAMFKKVGDAATTDCKIHMTDGTNTGVIIERTGMANTNDSIQFEKFLIVQDATTLVTSPSSFETFGDYVVNSGGSTGRYQTVTCAADWSIIISALSTGGAEAISLEIAVVEVIRP